MFDGLPPTLNHYYGHSLKHHRRFITKEGLQFKARVRSAVKGHAKIERHRCLKMELLFASDKWFTKGKDVHPSRMAGDVDNRQKILLDVLSEIYDFDDCQIFDLHARKITDNCLYTKIILSTI